MPYVPRPATTAQCAHCGANFEKKHASRKYCSNSCNVQASYARTGYREGRTTRADLEQALAKMTHLVELMTSTPAPADKAALKAKTKEKLRQARLALAAEQAIETAKTIEQERKPATKAEATKPKSAKKTVSTVKKGITTPAPAAKAAAAKPKRKITTTTPPTPAAKAAAKKKLMKAAFAQAAQLLGEKEEEQARHWEVRMDRQPR